MWRIKYDPGFVVAAKKSEAAPKQLEQALEEPAIGAMIELSAREDGVPGDPLTIRDQQLTLRNPWGTGELTEW